MGEILNNECSKVFNLSRSQRGGGGGTATSGSEPGTHLCANGE